MKKGWTYFLIVVLISALIGCKSEKPKESQQENPFDMKIGTNIVDTYMRYLIKGDIENSKKLYSKELVKNSKEQSPMELMVKGYQISETNEVGKSGQFKVKVTRVSQSSPITSLDEYNIKVIIEEKEYKISEINNVVQKEAFIEDEAIRLRSKNNIKTNLILDKGGIPQYAFSKDDKANIYKLQVPKNKFGAIAFSYEGDSLAISTYDKNSYIGIVKIDESQAVQGGGKDETTPSKGEEGKPSTAGPKEKPIGKEMISLDYIKDAKVDFMTFSLDQKFLLIQYSKANLGKCLRVYKAENGDLIPVKFEESYPLDKVEVLFSSFDKQSMTYEVFSKGSTDKSIESLVGKWQLDLKEFKMKKL